MSGFKGTPGPWEFVPAAPDDKDGRHGGRDMGGFRCASGWVCSFGDGMTYYPSEGIPPEPEDARLIAAAPELLEMLQTIEARWESDGWGYNEEVRERTRALIAKATGGDA